ncbi:SPRY-domain-containing protein [Gigaspora margarita]|uniref:SPRY-domain-containing protein n=1 Tax=Gigaspora margarita TaxID=4874 RepID=A0A8H4B4N3_GIGMA|nr:SPRY-domain-containing protein [Gigaspora margarita]
MMSRLQTSRDLELLRIDGFETKYIGPEDYNVAARILTNNPIPFDVNFFYFEVKIMKKEKNGIFGVGFCTKPIDQNKKTDDLYMAIPGNKNL